jgi:hypothetical protein
VSDFCSKVLGIDETPILILDPDLAPRAAYLYAQYGDDTQPYVGYYFAPHKTRVNIEAMLKGFQGTLQSDAYICYELITGASLDRIKAAACWAHGRRKFEPLIASGPHPQASWILRQIRELYDIEDRAADMTDEQRLLRQAESRRSSRPSESGSKSETKRAHPIVPPQRSQLLPESLGIVYAIPGGWRSPLTTIA